MPVQLYLEASFRYLPIIRPLLCPQLLNHLKISYRLSSQRYQKSPAISPLQRKTVEKDEHLGN